MTTEYKLPDMAISTDLERFTGENPAAGEEALRRMEPKLRRFLQSYLRNYVRSHDDIDDLCMVVLEKLWRRRREIEISSETAWWGYVAKTARNAAFDMLDRPEQQRPQFELQDSDVEAIEGFCDSGETLDEILQAADELWLESDAELVQTERRRRLLAAQLHFLDRRPWQEIVRLVSPHASVSRAELDEWLAARGTRLELAFGRLYGSNDEVCRLLLSSEAEDIDLDELARRVRSGAEPVHCGGWREGEILIILLRYRNGLGTDKIVQMSPGISPDDVERVAAQCAARLPFADHAEGLKLAFAPTDAAESTVRADGLWRRLVLQYFAVDDLPQKHILERVGPAAEAAEVKMNAGILNSWLSNGRIFSQLLRFIQGRKGVASPETTTKEVSR